jgi:hypothetical protein
MDRLAAPVSIMIPIKIPIEYRLERNISIISIESISNFEDI